MLSCSVTDILIDDNATDHHFYRGNGILVIFLSILIELEN
jgi:hypothetical protein